MSAIAVFCGGAHAVDSISAADGFQVELVFSVPSEQGSWVAITADPAGGLIASAQYGGLYRVAPSDAEGRRPTVVTAIDTSIRGAQGLLFVDGDLYCSVDQSEPDGPGLYRLRRDGDEAGGFGAPEKLRDIPGQGGEHGRHGLALGPDGMIYMVVGNHIALPPMDRSTVPMHWGEDLLLPRLWDANGHARGLLAPGGWIGRTDRDGGTWELFAVGFRNPYDIAFDRNGELFTFDADMEWDLGAPWYRPTRINHVTSGSEFGWRSGSGKWPTHYPDSLPAVVDIGPGSPTGVTFGTGARFPARYQRALFALDWTYGTMYAVHLAAEGASFSGRAEQFVTGLPLPLTDAIVNVDDGCLYFAVGGRRTASALYRVRYVGDESTIALPRASTPAPAVVRRRQLEAWHRAGLPRMVLDKIIPALGDSDRFIRYAARVALEHQPLDRWAADVLADPDRGLRLAAALALARVGGQPWRDEVIRTLLSFDWETSSPRERLDVLRGWTLCFVRTGEPDDELRRRLITTFDDNFPSNDMILDRELSALLVYLDAPSIVARTIALMERAAERDAEQVDRALLERGGSYGQAILQHAASPTQAQQVHFAFVLRQARSGWTDDLRQRYFRWFESARYTSGGNSFSGFLDAIRNDALAVLPEADRERYLELGLNGHEEIDPAVWPEGPGRAWTVSDIVATVNVGSLRGRSLERGRSMYTAAMCARCHRVGGTGVAGGPDLNGVASRFTIEDLATAIVEPSRVISDQYELTEFVMKDGRVVLGRPVPSPGGNDGLRIMSSMLVPQATFDIPLEQVEERRRSAVSPMMPHLIDAMNAEELLDLFAYLLSGGDPDSPMFE